MKTSKDSYKSTLGFKHFPNREAVFKSPYQWLEDKKAYDGAEGLWRVHDGLYDVADFIQKHPGGQFWLDVTKGTDITEAFEAHHISTNPEKILKKYFVRNARTPRNSPFTFHEDGFYRTLKRNVREALKTIPKNTAVKTDVTIDVLLIISFILSVLAAFYWNYAIGVFAGIFVSFTALASHNYYHQKDNFRMYYSDITLMQSGEWRIIHILSHHLYTNTISDMQAYATEPLIQYFPHEKSFMAKYGSWIYAPFILWPILVCILFIVRIYQWLMLGYHKQVRKTDLLAAILPSIMYLLGGQPLLQTLGMWLFIIAIHSFWFLFIGVAATHFHPDVFFDGDEPRPKNQLDWGISQLDTTSDRYEVMGSHLLSLLTFGDHALHHLFPTLDQAVLEQLYPIVGETMKQFNLNIRMTNHHDMIAGYFRRLAIDKPNVNPPDLLKGRTLF